MAYSIVNQGLCSELSLVDIAHDKVVGEALDLQHGSAFTKHVAVRGSSSYDISEGSDVVVLTAGVRQREGESRLDLVGRNLNVLQSESAAHTLALRCHPSTWPDACTAGRSPGRRTMRPSLLLSLHVPNTSQRSCPRWCATPLDA